jgi:hypothetical protein
VYLIIIPRRRALNYRIVNCEGRLGLGSLFFALEGYEVNEASTNFTNGHDFFPFPLQNQRNSFHGV